jgi:hypothetical protein
MGQTNALRHRMLSRDNVVSPQIGPRHAEMENKPSAFLSSMDGAKAGAAV